MVIITIATALFTSQLAGCSDNNKESLQKIETASSKVRTNKINKVEIKTRTVAVRL